MSPALNPIDLSLYLVLDPDLCGGADGMVETARIAARHGATVVQLRAPRWKKRQWLDTALALKAVLDPLGVPLIINDQVGTGAGLYASDRNHWQRHGAPQGGKRGHADDRRGVGLGRRRMDRSDAEVIDPVQR